MYQYQHRVRPWVSHRSMALHDVSTSKKRSASETYDKCLPSFKVPKDGVQRAEINDSAIQYEDPWEDEFEEEQDNGDQTEHSDDDKSSLPYYIP